MPFHIQSWAWILDLSQGSSAPYNLNRRQFNDTPHQPNKKKKGLCHRAILWINENENQKNFVWRLVPTWRSDSERA